MFELIQGLSEWQIYGIVFWLLLQGMVVSVLPEEVIILSLGVLISQNRVRLPFSFIAVELGLLTANSMLVFVAGRFSERRIFKKASIQNALTSFRTRGNRVIFIARFTPLIRGPIYAAIGLSGMRVRDFFKIDATASLFQVPALLALGAYIGDKTGSIEKAYKVIGICALGVVALMLLSIAVKAWIKKKSSRAAE